MNNSMLPVLFLLVLLQGCLVNRDPEPVVSDWRDVVLPPASSEITDNIEKNRKGDVTLVLRDNEGNPLPAGVEAEIELINHEFLFGCNFFNWGQLEDDPTAKEAYREQFADLFNFATLAFYWGSYESEKNKPDLYTRSRETAEWCRDRNITVKGHPLVWHEVYPYWARDFSEEEMLNRLENRVRSIVSDHAGLIDMWDVINESQASAKYNNPFGRWVKRIGADEAVAETFKWAEESNPDGFFLINDYDIHDGSYLEQIENLLKMDVKPDAIGMQSHMHHGAWSNTMILDAYNRIAKLNIPIHFTELTVLSGRPMSNWDYSTTRKNWNTIPKIETQQAEELVRIYRLLFSLPLMEAITCWDFSDRNAWMGAPAGLVRKDMSPKPAYYYLMKLIHSEWSTSLTAQTGEDGRISFRGFYGDYRISVDGQSYEYRFSSKNGEVPELRME